jgi:alpha-galactosidase
MTNDQYIVHFSLWAMVKSPLILGNDLTKMDNVTKAILANPAIIHVNQIAEGAGQPARRVKGGQGELQIWKGDLNHGEYVVAVMNWTNEDLTLDLLIKDVFKDEAPSVRTSHFYTEDLWNAPYYAFAGVSSDFGNNAVPELVTEKMIGVQVRKQAGRVWKFTLKSEKERRDEEAGRRERQREDL